MSTEKKLQPMQAVERDEKGVIRFRKNGVVCWLFDEAAVDLNQILLRGFSTEDVEQAMQLLGFSVSGFCDHDLNPATEEMAQRLALGLSASPTAKQNAENDDGRWREGYAAGFLRATEIVRSDIDQLLDTAIKQARQRR